MNIINNQHLFWIVLLLISRTKGQSINQPKLCASATWNSNALTFADEYIIGNYPTTVFVNVNNSVYVAEGNASQVQIWNEADVMPMKTLSNSLMDPYGLFVSNNGDIYIDNGASNGRVEKWTWNATSGVTVMNVSGSCYSLFVDINNTLYCSLNSFHQVIKASLNNLVGNSLTAAGKNGTAGAASNLLNEPHGIFVDNNLNLYVADSGNNRIQFFQFNQLNAITVAGVASTISITLNYPTAIILDADRNLFIADTNNNRIIRTDPSGFRCLVGCTGSSGSAANQLNGPSSLSFDSYGNLFIIDQNNARIQKFILATNSCGLSYNQPKFCPTAIWNPDAVTFVDNTVVGLNPYSIFVSINNTIYATATDFNQIQIWSEGSSIPTMMISADFNSSYAIVASIIGDIYIDNNDANQVDRWTANATTSTIVEMYTSGPCFSLFIDVNDNLYCSLGLQHKVIRKTINNGANTSILCAGTGIMGSSSSTLNEPRGIFVDAKFNLYVADCRNNRVQRFPSGQFNAITAVGNGATGTMTLNCPTGLVLDADGYLFITDFNNHRIIGSGPNGYRCLVGCMGTSGSSSNQLNNPSSLSFDSYGNLFVADMNNSRIQQFFLATNSCGPSYNQPKFCSSATWNPTGITFANSTTVGIQPFSVFINTNNTVYIADKTNNNVQIWIKGATTPITAIFNDLSTPYSVFATITGDIYVDNGASNGRVDQWIANTPTSTNAMNVSGICYGLFLDIYNNIYCSLGDFHQVIRKSSNDANTSTIVAGVGVSGNTTDMLNTPQGIFVSTTFNLYVADSGNNRIQLFRSKQLNATTIAGNGAPKTITLNYPTGVILDNQGYLFIVDTNNNRIIGSSANGFRCIIGCSSGSGSGSDQLNYPRGLSFDSSGNLFVADAYNNRIQKFSLTTNSCGRSYNLPKFCTYAAWNPIGTTFANNTTVGSYPSDIFISTQNTIYVAETYLNQVQIWLQGHSIPTITISAGLNLPYAVFTSIIGDIYIDNTAVNHRVDKWTANATISIIEMYSNATCYDLFTDTYDNLYCSLNDLHVVIKRSFNDDAYTTTIIAGNTTNGSDSYMLNEPRGIFIDIKFNLYVADCGNNRIQMFQLGQLNGSTIVENTPTSTITLSCPTALILDADGHLFITDYDNHRIIATGPNGLKCIIGCSGYGGSADNELYNPRSLSFDTHGNIYVTDIGNQRIQKFVLATNSCYAITTASTENIVPSTLSTEIVTTNIPITSKSTSIQSSESFNPPSCPTVTSIGPNCNIYINACDILNPCQNDGTCFNDNTTLFSYICLCPPDVYGTECQYDYRLCRSDTCWNNGTCFEKSNETFLCTCADGWQNSHCELLIDYCKNISCLNNGICRPLLLNYKCECLGNSYSGQFCEIVSTRITTLQIVSKSFAFVAILAMISAAAFIIIMDILTYCFGIDLVRFERDWIRRREYMKKKKSTFFTQYNSVRVRSMVLPQRSTLIVEKMI